MIAISATFFNLRRKVAARKASQTVDKDVDSVEKKPAEMPKKKGRVKKDGE